MAASLFLITGLFLLRSLSGDLIRSRRRKDVENLVLDEIAFFDD